jgi:hypothetical protein
VREEKKEKDIFKFKKWSLSITKDKCEKVLKFDQQKCQKQMCDLGTRMSLFIMTKF